MPPAPLAVAICMAPAVAHW